MPSLEELGFSRSHRKELAVDIQLEDPRQMVPSVGLDGTKIEYVNANRIVSGTITSKQVSLAVKPDDGDVYFNAGKTDFDNTETGFILGVDDSDSDLPKFYIGTATQYFNFDGVNVTIKGALSTSSIDIPDTTTDNSFHVDVNGNTWWGANVATGYAGAPAYVLNTGEAKFSNVIVNNSELAFQNDFGDGSDGAVTISVNTTLTRDMFYTSLVVNNSITLNAGSFRVFCSTSLTNNGTIHNNGNNGSNGVGASGGAGGVATPAGSLPAGLAGKDGGSGGSSAFGPVVGDPGAAGGNGTDVAKCLGSSTVAGANGGAGGITTGDGGAGGAGGTAGTITGTIYNIPKNMLSAYFMMDFVPTATRFELAPSAGGAGGGGGGEATTGTVIGGTGGGGGGGGGTGGMVWIASKIIINNGTISVTGGNGGNAGNAGGGQGSPPGNAGGGGGGGGGAGGNGGVIFLIYSSYTNTGTLNIDGGIGGDSSIGGPGTGGYGSGYDGADGIAGTNGNVGSIIQLQI
jgi:hypothetical protein